MYPILFKIGPFTVYSFGTLMALGALAAGWVVRSELSRYRHNTEIASTIIVAAAVGGFIGVMTVTAQHNPAKPYQPSEAFTPGLTPGVLSRRFDRRRALRAGP